ncbi:MAG: GspH/FimT family protein [Thiohalocapsa sp.]|nr:GspH/FimT family protein [Thiohalocapsa sp.]MCF7990567.1 GspH/FimT family protein [Thiohalocapsa sp.]
MTLIELIVVVAVGLVLLSTAVPSFYEVMQNNRLTAQSNDFAATLTQARSEARKRRLQITVCKSSDGENCSTSNSVTWENGWISFIDLDRDADIDTDDVVLRTADALTHGSTLRAGAEFTRYIAYRPDGRCIGNGNTTPPAQGSFRLCDKRGKDAARQILISPIGRPSVNPTRGVTACP